MTQGPATEDIAGRTTPGPELQRQPRTSPDDAAPPADLTQLPLLDDVEADELLARWSEVQRR